jgi:hypothetical protein
MGFAPFAPFALSYLNPMKGATLGCDILGGFAGFRNVG